MRRFRVLVSYGLDVTAKTKRDAVKEVERCVVPDYNWRRPRTGFLTGFSASPDFSSDMKVEKIEPWNSSTGK